MFDWCRLSGRLFLCVLVLTARALSQTVPATTVQGTVYRADDTPAQGTLLISWSDFTTAAGQAISAGNTSVNLGSGGALSVALVPNAGAIPPKYSRYSAALHLDFPL
jgi:trimeric autotransporter adhesin